MEILIKNGLVFSGDNLSTATHKNILIRNGIIVDISTSEIKTGSGYKDYKCVRQLGYAWFYRFPHTL
jgi:formylmethanofuran dehydrogenase subunit A